MGWALLAFLGIGTFGVARLAGLPRALTMITAAALMLGATGYALQGRPGQPENRAVARTEAVTIGPEITRLRDAMLGRFTFAQDYFVVSDAMLRAGSPDAAATYMLSGINKAPRNYALWMGLGSALAERDGQAMSPAATFAFRRSEQLAPDQPAPWFFHGLALIRSGDFAAARPYWARAAAVAPAQRDYRPGLELRLAQLDQLLALMEQP